ncbi:DNA replication/repair protein RecF [Sphingomonas pseudosanguinis]|uniref:DNA replication and repair protein RecF n=1 Tax=Sphingomonas pseudosanguinis TaxID=413712 RepID=A0A7W6ABV4_9SPHN|nr:DNA replication/repair protein RecF [Sphingomonas pseudosanguinis]MBB3880462.1 DNA replication and repair protein RecF [Sphingomonas pseudosanguinis]MBN3537299.1 DNA replication/repair protein RecF [Sphingomonas pseudosanguinis]
MLTRLVLTDFRNHADLALTPAAGFVVLTGENGAGKTNVLEAVSLLAPGRGLRRAGLSAMARQGGKGGFGVAATIVGDVEIATGALPSAPERRVVRVQGAAASANALADWLSVLWLTPAMDRLFVEPASERRRFLDRLVLALAPAHGMHATRYDAAMRERNRLLASDGPVDPDWLSALEARMVEHGAAVDAARVTAVAALDQRLEEVPDSVFARAALALEGEAVDPAGFAHALAMGRRRDAAAGRTLVGPHRADLSVTHVAKGQAAALCSTGEQKALLLGIVLAHADLVTERRGVPPVLLLDEVAAHLDPSRRAALFERLAGRGQVWMTGTEPGLFTDVPGEATRVAF